MNDSIPTVQGGGLFNGNPIPNVAATSTQSPGKNIAASLNTTFSPTLLTSFQFRLETFNTSTTPAMLVSKLP